MKTKDLPHLAAFVLLAAALRASAAEPSRLERVRLETSLGEIWLDVYPARAPITVSNFLRYVDGGFYDGGQFHRTVTSSNQPTDKVRITVIQGGANPSRAAQSFPAIPLERTRDTALRHTNGVVSMARAAPPDTATSDFFICLGPQPELDFGGKRNPDGQGFAAFGVVVRGMETVERIHRAHADGQKLNPPIRILRLRRTATEQTD